MDHCIGCQSELMEVDNDPNGDKNAVCVRCRAEEAHDFDADPDVWFDRQGNMHVDEYGAKQRTIIESKWAVGANDRGLGRYVFGVIIDDGSGGSAEPVFPNISKQLAEHLVEIHNAALEGDTQ